MGKGTLLLYFHNIGDRDLAVNIYRETTGLEPRSQSMGYISINGVTGVTIL